jgi:hypothetical protein
MCDGRIKKNVKDIKNQAQDGDKDRGRTRERRESN